LPIKTRPFWRLEITRLTQSAYSCLWQSGILLLILFVFALAERKNEKNIIRKYHLAADPHTQLRFAHQAMMNIGALRHIFEFAAVGAGTQLTQSLIVEPRGIGKLLGQFMRFMLRRRIGAINSEINDYALARQQASA